MERGPRRNSLRLAGYDYASAGFYFITICTHQRQMLFKAFVGADLCVRPSPDIIPLRWLVELERKYAVKIDAYAILPDHIHMILRIPDTYAGPPLPEMMQWYKAQTTNAMMQEVRADRQPPFLRRVWQRGYYDHILRNKTDIQDTRQYILDNPSKWILNDKE